MTFISTSLIILALVTTILYFIFSFVLNLLFTTLSLIIPFFALIGKFIGVILGALAFVFAYLIASAIFGNKLLSNIIKITVIAILVSFGIKIIAWILSPLASILNFFFPLICIFIIKELLD